MMIGTFIVVMAFILFVGGVFVYCSNKIQTMDSAARDKGSEIDTNIWDRGYRLKLLVDILNDKGIEHSIEAPSSEGLALGMPPSMQEASADSLDKMELALRAIIDERKDLMDDPDFKMNFTKFTTARKEMKTNSLNYNKCVARYNGFISKFPGNVFASMYKKFSKARFNYIFIDLEQKSNPTDGIDLGDIIG